MTSHGGCGNLHILGATQLMGGEVEDRVRVCIQFRLLP